MATGTGVSPGLRDAFNTDLILMMIEIEAIFSTIKLKEFKQLKNAVLYDIKQKLEIILYQNEIARIFENSIRHSSSHKRMAQFYIGASNTAVVSNLCDSPSEEISTRSCAVQTELMNIDSLPTESNSETNDWDEIELMNKTKNAVVFSEIAKISDKEILYLMKQGKIKPHQLESLLCGDDLRAVALRRSFVFEANSYADDIPFKGYDYSVVNGACCENIIGYMTVPIGFAGPLLINNRLYRIPLSTTEGALVASINRGCRALASSPNGATAVVYNDSMTRAPIIQLDNSVRAVEMMDWLSEKKNFDEIKQIFDSTSRFARLKSLKIMLNDRELYVRFAAVTGDAMGMNMVSKGVSAVLPFLRSNFPDMKVLSISGNYCVDKKASAVNWIEGRGKSVICEAIIPESVVQNVLKTNVDSLVALSDKKLHKGSSVSCTVGGWNAQAANIVAAIFLATGQDLGQIVSSSMCMTSMQQDSAGNLRISCNMRCLEVGTVGGGTNLPAQKACLMLLGCAGGHLINPGENSKRLAEIICSTVMAGELSLMAALCTNDLVTSHLRLNRSDILRPIKSTSTAPMCRSYSDRAAPQKNSTQFRGNELYDDLLVELSCSNIL